MQGWADLLHPFISYKLLSHFLNVSSHADCGEGSNAQLSKDQAILHMVSGQDKGAMSPSHLLSFLFLVCAGRDLV